MQVDQSVSNRGSQGVHVMRVHVLFVLPGAFLILLEVNVLNGYTVVDYTGIVALVFKYYHSKCIILLYSPTNVYIGKHVATF